ncbi:receptor expression-enhancing protein 1 isoform X2 [Nematostella vectensis]|uniref:receptor expression-enhancing protein 1 isoform X2 n=1 Tax=Nematostella vectensis TaxID=45351 RepID=UPI00138FF705|nr:receptor expression-enhancing protein 1 isoform X2 [Nematostella vectensis]
MVSYIASRIIMLVFGTLYPAYNSYKAIKTKNVREYVRWMMYWIVFALFITAELFTDMLLGVWFPFYYEIKIIFMLWLLSPTTKGSSVLYRKFVHPMLSKHEKEIDSYIEQAKESGYDTLIRVSRNSISIAAETMMRTAVTGQNVLAEKLRQYGTEGVDGSDGRLRKAKSWYGGMDSEQNDYQPIDETGQPIHEEEEMEYTDPDAESDKLQDELRENKGKEKRSTRKSPQYSSSTLPRSYNRSSSYTRIYSGGYSNEADLSTNSRSNYESATLPRNYEGRYSTRSSSSRRKDL